MKHIMCLIFVYLMIFEHFSDLFATHSVCVYVHTAHSMRTTNNNTRYNNYRWDEKRLCCDTQTNMFPCGELFYKKKSKTKQRMIKANVKVVSGQYNMYNNWKWKLKLSAQNNAVVLNNEKENRNRCRKFLSACVRIQDPGTAAGAGAMWGILWSGPTAENLITTTHIVSKPNAINAFILPRQTVKMSEAFKRSNRTQHVYAHFSLSFLFAFYVYMNIITLAAVTNLLYDAFL